VFRRRSADPRRKGARFADRAIGILLGLVLGVAIVVGFVFWGSGETIDAPSLSGDEPAQTQTQTERQAQPPATAQP
jgi:hypothetical protein